MRLEMQDAREYVATIVTVVTDVRGGRLAAAAATAAAATAAVYVVARSASYILGSKGQSFWGRFGFLDKDTINAEICKYNSFYGASDDAPASETDCNAVPTLVDKFYSLVTDIYILGWGESFHFAPIRRGERWEDAMRRHEIEIGACMGGVSNKQLLDVGCGIGGPMRTIASSDPTVHITGITINQYQVDTCNSYNANKAVAGAGSPKLSDRCQAVQGNFLKMPFASESFDGAYAVEATCHAPELKTVYAEVFRVLKPGSFFVSYEWVTTKIFDENNKAHVQTVHDVVVGNALESMRSENDVTRSAAAVGFEVVKIEDQALRSEVPWYSKLQRSSWSRAATHAALTVMEWFWLVPSGTSSVHLMLCKAADSLVLSGTEGIFTPMCTCVFRKP